MTTIRSVMDGVGRRLARGARALLEREADDRRGRKAEYSAFFARGEDAARVAESPDDVQPVVLITLDGGRTGWRVQGDATEPMVVCQDIEAFLRERELAKLTADEREALGL